MFNYRMIQAAAAVVSIIAALQIVHACALICTCMYAANWLAICATKKSYIGVPTV